jgi:hypothetical protein
VNSDRRKALISKRIWSGLCGLQEARSRILETIQPLSQTHRIFIYPFHYLPTKDLEPTSFACKTRSGIIFV